MVIGMESLMIGHSLAGVQDKAKRNGLAFMT